MTNDLTTLSGALLEMKDQLIYELGQKGVTASYDSSTGLLGLIGEISNIQQGGSCYHIELDDSAYTTTGSLTVSATLTSAYDDSAIVGATVTFTSSTSTTTTATTDSTGVATATISFSASTTLTATYSNVTDTATITVQQGALYYDSCDSSTGLSNYGNPVPIYNSQLNGTITMEYNSTKDSYSITGTNGSDYVILPISALDGESSFTFSCEVNVQDIYGGQIGLGVMPTDLTTTYANILFLYSSADTSISSRGQRRRITASSNIASVQTHTTDPTEWYRIKVTFDNSNGFTCVWETIDGTQLRTVNSTVNPTINDRHYGIYYKPGNGAAYKLFIREIKAERSA